MDTMHNWVLWRSLLFALIALPFIVAAILRRLLQQRSQPPMEASNGSSRVDETPTYESVITRLRGPAHGASQVTEGLKWPVAKPRGRSSTSARRDRGPADRCRGANIPRCGDPAFTPMM